MSVVASNWSVSQRSLRDLDELEGMPPDLRACVHEFGSEIVRACVKNGVTSPGRIRDLVREIWAGARQSSQSGRGGRLTASAAVNKLDWLLIQSGSSLSAKGFLRAVDFNGFMIVPQGVSSSMVNASMTAIDGMGLLSKRRKHEIRLHAAMKVARDHFVMEMRAAE